MKVFISWSGDISKELAEIFREWLPTVIQAVKPYFTPGDIDKGARWNIEISKELEESKAGLIMLTPENLEAPWIMFEAGALSKNISTSKVCPILFNIESVDIKGPLVQFQAAKFNKEDIKKVVMTINKSLGEDALSATVFEDVFEVWWPKLKEKVDVIMAGSLKKRKIQRPEREILEEILELSRDTSKRISEEKTVWNVKAINDQLNTGYSGYSGATISAGDFLTAQNSVKPIFWSDNAGVFRKMCSKCSCLYTPSVNDKGLCESCSKA